MTRNEKIFLNENGAFVDYGKNKIYFTKWFKEKAGIPNSIEYKTRQQLIQEHQGFVVEYKQAANPDKESHKGLNIETMRKYIERQIRINLISADVLKEFEYYEKENKRSKGFAGTMKKWFLDKFPEQTSEIKQFIKAEEEKALEMAKQNIKDEILRDGVDIFVAKRNGFVATNGEESDDNNNERSTVTENENEQGQLIPAEMSFAS